MGQRHHFLQFQFKFNCQVEMHAPIRSILIIYPNEKVMLNGNRNDDGGSSQIFPHVAQPYQMEETESLVPEMALNSASVLPILPA